MSYLDHVGKRLGKKVKVNFKNHDFANLETNSYIHPNKHSSWSRRTEDVLKTSWRRLQCNIFLSSKTSWRRLEDIIGRRLANTSWKCLEDVLEDVLKTCNFIKKRHLHWCFSLGRLCQSLFFNKVAGYARVSFLRKLQADLQLY